MHDQGIRFKRGLVGIGAAAVRPAFQYPTLVLLQNIVVVDDWYAGLMRQVRVYRPEIREAGLRRRDDAQAPGRQAGRFFAPGHAEGKSCTRRGLVAPSVE